jgi:hypothetical protein
LSRFGSQDNTALGVTGFSTALDEALVVPPTNGPVEATIPSYSIREMRTPAVALSVSRNLKLTSPKAATCLSMTRSVGP